MKFNISMNNKRYDVSINIVRYIDPKLTMYRSIKYDVSIKNLPCNDPYFTIYRLIKNDLINRSIFRYIDQ